MHFLKKEYEQDWGGVDQCFIRNSICIQYSMNLTWCMDSQKLRNTHTHIYKNLSFQWLLHSLKAIYSKQQLWSLNLICLDSHTILRSNAWYSCKFFRQLQCYLNELWKIFLTNEMCCLIKRTICTATGCQHHVIMNIWALVKVTEAKQHCCWLIGFYGTRAREGQRAPGKGMV